MTGAECSHTIKWAQYAWVQGQGDDASSNLMISRSCGIIEIERSLLVKFSASSLLSPLLMLHTLLLSRMVSYSRGWIMSKETSSSSTEKGTLAYYYCLITVCIGYATPEKSDFWFHKAYKDVSTESFLVNSAFCSFAQQIEKNCNGLFWAVHQWEE